MLLGLDPAVAMDEDVGTRRGRKRALGDVLTAVVEPLAKATAGALLTTEPPVTEVGLSALSLATCWLSPLMADTLISHNRIMHLLRHLGEGCLSFVPDTSSLCCGTASSPHLPSRGQ